MHLKRTKRKSSPPVTLPMPIVREDELDPTPRVRYSGGSLSADHSQHMGQLETPTSHPVTCHPTEDLQKKGSLLFELCVSFLLRDHAARRREGHVTGFAV
jgi:hypothetical protein